MLGAAMGLIPHLLHHAGLFAGTALVAGLGGTVLFGVLGLAVMAPMLLRLRRRFGSWSAPGAAVLLFGAMFAVSALLIGPMLRGGGTGSAPQPGPSHSVPAGEHGRQHG
ncbi:hypothetical protein Q0Z83_056580 [Actinoplanes sichuanensis]|nr:hypothetical protein Q0Z83_056580 [Actinoplanes sichuanensis]